MNWINNLFYMGLFTALTGSIAFAVYAVVAGVLDGLKKYRYIYGLLLVVLPFWLFPGRHAAGCRSSAGIIRDNFRMNGERCT